MNDDELHPLHTKFITKDGDLTFNMIEDEQGDLFWAYGHVTIPFIDDVNRWLIHACGACVPEDLFATNTPVEHLWVRFEHPDDEHFTVVEQAPDAIPVSRILI